VSQVISNLDFMTNVNPDFDTCFSESTANAGLARGEFSKIQKPSEQSLVGV
jgi:hypothetical protein